MTTHNAPAGFRIHPRRWVVERALAWFARDRRLGKGYAARVETGGARTDAATTHRMVRRLRPATESQDALSQ